MPNGTRVDELESAVRTVCEPIFNKPLKEISFAQVLLRLFATARRFDMQVQPQLILLQKTLFNIEGLGRQLYPELDLWKTAQPVLRAWMRERISPRTIFKEIRARIARRTADAAPDPANFADRRARGGGGHARPPPIGIGPAARGTARRRRGAPRPVAWRCRRAVAVRLDLAGASHAISMAWAAADVRRHPAVPADATSRLAKRMRIPIESSTSYRGRNSRPNLPALALFVVLALGVGVVGALFSPACSARGGAVVRNVWRSPLGCRRKTGSRRSGSALYVLMGDGSLDHLARTLSSRPQRRDRRLLGAVAAQRAWAPLFFGLKNIGAGLFEIVALWLAVGWTVREFARVKPVAAWILAPYFFWVSFAVAINLAIWKLNP